MKRDPWRKPYPLPSMPENLFVKQTMKLNIFVHLVSLIGLIFSDFYSIRRLICHLIFFPFRIQL